MRIALFCHSILSDWNHGNAHFLRGVVTELMQRSHDVRVYEPRNGWSVTNLTADHGFSSLSLTRAAFPGIAPVRYDEGTLDLDLALDGCAAVLVHEWNDPGLVRALGERRRRGGRFALLFHDTHHRSATRPEEMGRYDLSAYDGVLAFGESIRRTYEDRGWGKRAFVWHEAADTRIFYPLPSPDPLDGDVVWVGNWGDDERTRELEEYLLAPSKALGLRGSVFGVRYPEPALRALADAGLRYCGWLPNFHVPAQLAAHLFTVHVPRRPYATRLPGIPTIRVFESLACGTPLVCAPWEDAENLFRPGEDYLVATDGDTMRRHMRDLVSDPSLRSALGARGRATVLARHTCAHRVDELLGVLRQLVAGGSALEVRP